MSGEEGDQNNTVNYQFKGMIFEGGGPAGVAHVGAIRVFEEKGILDQINYFVGSSAGAIAAGSLACGANVSTLEDILFNTDFNKFKDDSTCVCKDIYRFIKHYGWFKGDVIEAWFQDVAERLTGNPKITFKEVYQRYGNYLGVTVTDVNNGKTLYLDHLNSPDMPLSLAIKRSSIMPLFFKADKEVLPTRIVHDGKVKTKNITHYYTDGGLLNNYPIQALDQVLDKSEVIGFKLMSSKELSEINNAHMTDDSNAPKHVVEYIMMLYTILRNQALKIHINDDDWQRTVKIDVGTISATDFDLSDTDKYFLIDQGKMAAEKFLADCN